MTITSSTAASVAEESVTVRGTGLRLLRSGSGPPILVLHGSGDRGDWVPFLSLLAEEHSVLRPDHPGFNWSDDDDRIDSVHDLAFFYLDFLDELGLDAVDLVGISLGGWIAAELAILAGSRVGKLILIDAAGIRVEGVPAPDYFLLGPEELSDTVWHDPDIKAHNLEWGRTVAEDAEAFGRFLRGRASTAHLAWNPYFHDPKLLERVHRIRSDTMILWGAEDRLFPVAYGQRWRELIPQAGFHVIENAGHLPHVERPDEVHALVKGFLAEGAER